MDKIFRYIGNWCNTHNYEDDEYILSDTRPYHIVKSRLSYSEQKSIPSWYPGDPRLGYHKNEIL
jgi:hypothetical protein